MLPLDVFRSWHFVVLDHQFISMKKVLLLGFINAATATTSHHIVTAAVKKIVFIEVSKTVHLRFFILEVNKS